MFPGDHRGFQPPDRGTTGLRLGGISSGLTPVFKAGYDAAASKRSTDSLIKSSISISDFDTMHSSRHAPMDKGRLLEDLCVSYLQRVRRHTETYYDDPNVRHKLQLAKDCSCADILSLYKPERLIVEEVTIAEAKAAGSAKPDEIGRQLGTAAAQAMVIFPKLKKINLLVFTDKLIWAKDAKENGGSGIKIVAKQLAWPDGIIRPELFGTSADARIVATVDPRAGKDASHLAPAIAKLPIEVVLSSRIGDYPQRKR